MARKIKISELTTLGKLALAECISEWSGIELKLVRETLEALFEIYKKQLINKKSIWLDQAGYLSVFHKKARIGRNPKTLEEHMIPDRHAVTLGKPRHESYEYLGKYHTSNLLKAELEPENYEDIDCILNGFMNILGFIKDGDLRIEIRGFGVFYPKHFEERKARNPATGESVIAKEKTVVRFKCSKNLLEKINS